MSGYNTMETMDTMDYTDTVNKVFTTRKPKKKMSKRVHNVNKKVGKMGAQIGKASGILDGYGHNSDSEYEQMNNQNDTVMLYNVGGEIHADSQLAFAHEPVEMDDDFYYSRRWPANQDPRWNNNPSSTTPYRTSSDMYYHPAMRSQWPSSATPQPPSHGYHRDPVYLSGGGPRHTPLARHQHHSHQQQPSTGNLSYKNYPSDSDYPFDYDPPRAWSAAGDDDRKFYSDGDYYASSSPSQPAHLFTAGTPDHANHYGRKYTSREDLNRDYFSDYEQAGLPSSASRNSQHLDTGYHAISPEHYRTGSSLSVASSHVSQQSGSMHAAAAPTTTNSPTQQTPVAGKSGKTKISASANSGTSTTHSTSAGDLTSLSIPGDDYLDERENAFKRRATSPNISYRQSRSRSNSQHLQPRKASSNTSTPSKTTKQKKLLFNSSEPASAFSLKTIVHKIRGKDGKKAPSGYGSPMGLATKQPSIIDEEAVEDDSDGMSAGHSSVKHSRAPSVTSHRTSHSAAHSTGSKSLAVPDNATVRSRASHSRFSARALSRDPIKRSASATPAPAEIPESQSTAWTMMSGAAAGAVTGASSVGNYLWTSLAGDKGPLEFFFGEIPNKGEEIRREDSPIAKRGRSRSAHTVRSRSGSRSASVRAESVSQASIASRHSAATITPEVTDNASSSGSSGSSGSKFKERWKSFFVTTSYPRSPSPESMIAPTAPAAPASVRSVSRSSRFSRSHSAGTHASSIRAASVAPSMAPSEASVRTLRAAPDIETESLSGIDEGPAARLVSHFVNASRSCARLSYILVPVDAIADAFPSLQSIVVVIELFLLLWLLYQLSILVETLAIAVKAFCMPVIMICRLMGLNK